jgi:membrane protein required for colicin V production
MNGLTVNDFTLVDWAIFIAITLAVLGGLSQGFFRSVCSLGGLILGLALAAWNYRIVAAPINSLMHSEEASNILGFILIAMLVMIVAGIVGALLHKTFQKIGLGCLDRLAGAVFGFFQGVLLVTLVILATVAFYPQARWLTEARLPRHFFAALHLSVSLTPEQLSEKVRSGLKLLEGQTPDWMHPRQNNP